jgi:hypothetical protein
VRTRIAGVGCLAIVIMLVVGASMAWQLGPKAKPNGRVERPPPAPPNCLPNPNLEQLTLADGSVAEVKVIKVRNTLLYIPSKWMQRYFVDLAENKYSWYDLRERFRPDLHDNECQGVVHELVLEGQTPRHGNNRGSAIWFDLYGNFAPIVISGTEGRTRGFGVTVEATVAPGGIEKGMPLSYGTGQYWIMPSADFFLIKRGFNGEANSAKYEAELRRLASWLMKRPAARNNDTVFFPVGRFP